MGTKHRDDKRSLEVGGDSPINNESYSLILKKEGGEGN